MVRDGDRNETDTARRRDDVIKRMLATLLQFRVSPPKREKNNGDSALNSARE